MSDNKESYPATLSIDYPVKADRLTSFFRIITIIPIMIILIFLYGTHSDDGCEHSDDWHDLGGGIVVVPTILMIVFRKKYPKWWFDWNMALVKFTTRVLGYLLLLSHEYPSTDEDQSVQIEIPYPDVKVDLHRGMPLVKWFLSIPHIIVLCFLYVAVFFTTILTWIMILFTGSNPKGMFDFVVGVMRWSLRVNAYAFILTTDKYPPFKLSE